MQMRTYAPPMSTQSCEDGTARRQHVAYDTQSFYSGASVNTYINVLSFFMIFLEAA